MIQRQPCLQELRTQNLKSEKAFLCRCGLRSVQTSIPTLFFAAMNAHAGTNIIVASKNLLPIARIRKYRPQRLHLAILRSRRLRQKPCSSMAKFRQLFRCEYVLFFPYCGKHFNELLYSRLGFIFHTGTIQIFPNPVKTKPPPLRGVDGISKTGYDVTYYKSKTQ